MTVGSRIRIIRRHYELNQTDFGARLGLSQAAIAGYENESHSVAEQTFMHICKEYKVNERWLRTGEGEMFEDTGNDFVSELSAKYQLNTFQQNLVRAVYEMPPEYQDMILALARRLVAENEAEHAETEHERIERIANEKLDEYDAQQAQQESDNRA